MPRRLIHKNLFYFLSFIYVLSDSLAVFERHLRPDLPLYNNLDVSKS